MHKISKYILLLPGHENQLIDITYLDAVLFHSPYCKLVQKSVARLVLNDFVRTPEKEHPLKYPGLEKFRYVKQVCRNPEAVTLHVLVLIFFILNTRYMDTKIHIIHHSIPNSFFHAAKIVRKPISNNFQPSVVYQPAHSGTLTISELHNRTVSDSFRQDTEIFISML
jgi:3-hydroxy-3-methylglutaryl CoA synthase